MFKTMLVPLDGSKAAEIVLPYVEYITSKLDTAITLISVSESAVADSENLFQMYLEHVKEKMQQDLKQSWSKPKVHIQTKVLSHKPADAILRYADESNVSLIAMASRGSSGQGPWHLGSIAAKVLRATVRPVLLIKAQVSEPALKQKSLIKKILLPLDGSKMAEAAIPRTEALARALGAELVLFQVVEPATIWGSYEGYPAYRQPPGPDERKASAMEYLAGVEKQLQGKGTKVTSVIDYGFTPERIIDYSKANDVDLIVLSTHGLSGIKRWAFGTVADKVLHAGETAIFVMRPQKE